MRDVLLASIEFSSYVVDVAERGLQLIRIPLAHELLCLHFSERLLRLLIAWHRMDVTLSFSPFFL